ncbi:RES family NAD+ phosphorylase [Xanthomonas campestris]|uniref:RES family NAD+ phosphorylase n=1 Tax=Xanthomonas campestris TaxID=339 RepID=UPI001E2E5A61|nr:RES family NAD+ phosphorylase [Xanthomonas campestris]MCD0261534.1 RES family NAD+ phosphorylase [Xanthomonas campestris pv. campestris]MCD0270206.1 RES family NAD+ phosphorylase [Xanthomonas campestris pv. campestris]
MPQSSVKGSWQSLLDIGTPRPEWACAACLNDEFIKQLCTPNAKELRCCGCGSREGLGAPIEKIAERIRSPLQQHYELDIGLYPGYELSLPQIIRLAIGCEHAVVVEAVASLLEDEEPDEESGESAAEESFYYPGQCYSRIRSPFDSEDHERWYVVGDWYHVAHDLVHGHRFFNDEARALFSRLLSEAMAATAPESPDSSAVLRILPEGSFIYRSRVSKDEDQTRLFKEQPGKQLGAAPRSIAANSRMSVAGVPVFYGSAELETCIAEVRPSIGDTVVAGQFHTTRPLKLFDFTRLDYRLRHEPLSLLDPMHEQRNMDRTLLSYLHEEIAKPIRSNDTGYVVTQALTEFIRYGRQEKFNGVAFQSVQHRNGLNYALFDEDDPSAPQFLDGRLLFPVDILTERVTEHVVDSLDYVLSPFEPASAT